MAYQTVNPANNQLIKSYPAHSDADVEAALRQADALYHSAWAKGDIAQRLPVLHACRPYRQPDGGAGENRQPRWAS